MMTMMKRGSEEKLSQYVRGIRRMSCHELRQLLESDWRENATECCNIVDHIHVCPHCRHGIVQLAYDLLQDDPLSCEQCRQHFPAYYEATRPDYPLVEMSDTTMARIVYHLSHCDGCREEYRVLVLLSELEERDEIAD
jgi:hypothetical protein